MSEWADILKAVQHESFVEIETSVGFCDSNGHYKAGIGFESFQNMYNAMQATEVWTKKKTKQSLIDYYFAQNIRGRYFGGSQKPEFICKKTLHSVLHSASGDRAVRLKVSRETPVEQIYKDPLSVRLTERWSFILHDKNTTWTYDLNKTVQGKTKEDACTFDPCFTVELEVKSPGIDAALLRARTIDLLGRFDTRGSMLAVQPSIGSVVKSYSA